MAWARMRSWTRRLQGVACAESGTDIGCGKVRTGAAPCRERLPGGDGAHLRGTGSVLRPNGPGDTVTTTTERFFMMYPSMAEVR